MKQIDKKRLIGISDQKKAFLVYDMLNGDCLYQGGFDDEKLC